MGEKTTKFIETERLKEKQARDDFLIDHGFYECVYMQEGDKKKDFPFYENGYRYRKVAEKVTEEEYQEILRIHKADPNVKTPGVATFCNIIAFFLFPLSVIVGLIVGLATRFVAGLAVFFQLALLATVLSSIGYLVEKANEIAVSQKETQKLFASALKIMQKANAKSTSEYANPENKPSDNE